MTDNSRSAACGGFQGIQFAECGIGICGFLLTTDRVGQHEASNNALQGPDR